MLPEDFNSAPPVRSLTVAEALGQLEDGSAYPGMQVELGRGRTVTLDDLSDATGLQQRLRAHRMLVAVASGQVAFPARAGAVQPELCPKAKELLDAVANTG